MSSRNFMEHRLSSFRLHILGSLGDYMQPLVTFAEFNNSRAVERIQLNKARVDGLAERIRALHEFIETSSPAWDDNELSDLGGQLFDMIVQKKVRRLFDEATGQNKHLNRLMPFEIFVEDSAITGWPWEYLYDSNSQVFLSQMFHPISRGIFTLYSDPELEQLKGKVRILIIIGVLPDDANTTSGDEIKWMKEVFNTKLATDFVEFKIMQAIGPVELDKELQKNHYDILHFFGHARFDNVKEEGYLKFERPGDEAFKFYATSFAQLLLRKGIRLAFLNACESGRTARNEDPARSSIAAAILASGVPAVIATQFSIPDVTAHYLSSMIYNGLVSGLPLMEAMQNGRRAMNYAPKSKFTDWGIPVLYTSDPTLMIFPPANNQPSAAAESQKVMQSDNFVKALGEPSAANSPALAVERTALADNKERAKVNIALIDFDGKVSFLPDLAVKANEAQHYYNFEVDYLPLPSGAIRTDFADEKGKPAFPQLYVPLIEDYLLTVPEDLNVNKVCGLTRCRIAGVLEDGEIFINYRASALDKSEAVSLISLYQLRDYAKQSAVSYAKATLYVCLSMIVATDFNGDIIHPETVGCLFDDCDNRDDIVVGLKNMKFDHEKCRSRIINQEQLTAIDTLLALKIDETT